MSQPMTTPKSDFLREAKARGFIHQVTDEAALDARLASGVPQIAYIGFDATADSLHAGSLVQIMLLRLWQRTGHRPLVLMGGGTTKIGDPSGKDEARKLLSDDDIGANIRGIRRIFDKYHPRAGELEMLRTHRSLVEQRVSELNERESAFEYRSRALAADERKTEWRTNATSSSRSRFRC